MLESMDTTRRNRPRPRLSPAELQAMLDDPGLGVVRVRFDVQFDPAKLLRMRTGWQRHLTQEELAARTADLAAETRGLGEQAYKSVSRATIGALEAGRRGASFATLRTLCKVFGCRAIDLVHDDQFAGAGNLANAG